MVVDGGNKESGQALVDHIKGCYKTTRVDYLVNTHPDIDHASGLAVVMENLQVGEAWVHQPWNYPHQILHWFKDGRITVDSLRERLQDDREGPLDLPAIWADFSDCREYRNSETLGPPSPFEKIVVVVVTLRQFVSFQYKGQGIA